MNALDEIRTRYRLAQPTFTNICKIGPQPERSAVFQTACTAIELQSFSIRPAERAWLRHVNEHTNIPYPIREPVTEPWHKASLLVQMDLSGQPWPAKLTQAARKELHGDRLRIQRVLDQVLRCLVDVLGHRGDGRGVSVGLDVLRSLHAKVWEGSGGGMELLQVDGIGMARLQKLGEAGVRTVRRLAGLECYHIERLMSRNPPYGQTLLRQLAGFPLLTLAVESLGEGGADGGGPRWMVRVVMGYENTMRPPVWKGKTPWVSCVMESRDDKEKEKGRLVWVWRGSLKRLDCEESGGGGGGKEVVVGVTGMVQKDFEL